MSTITSKGQVTIPKPVRDLLGLQPGATVNFEVTEDGRVFLQPEVSANIEASSFRRLRGSASKKLTTDEIMQLTRGVED